MEHLLRDREKEEQGISGLLGRLVSPLLNRQPAQSEKFTELTGGLSLDSAVTLKKVQRCLNDGWASAVNQPIQIHNGKSNRWASATTRKLATLKTSAQETIRAKASYAPTADEEIRGLDDIFPGREPAAVGSRSRSQAVNTGNQSPIRFDETVRRQVRWPYQDKNEPVREEAAVTCAQSVPELNPTCEAFSVQFAPEAVVTCEASPVQTELEPVSIEMPEIENSIDWFTLTEGEHEPEFFKQYLRPEGSEDIRLIQPSLAPEAEEIEEQVIAEAPTPEAPTVPQTLSIGEQLKLDQELEADLSSFDYMLRNNRILSSSISSLVDRYFESAKDDESAYY